MAKIKLATIALLAIYFIIGLSANCPSNCLLCLQGVCYSCENNYELRSNKCQPICDEYCTNCSSPGICTSCIAGYSKLNTTTNLCELICSYGFSGKCQTCSNLFYCKACKADNFLANNGRICSTIQSCNDKNCSKCAYNLCSVCQIGYKLLQTTINTTSTPTYQNKTDNNTTNKSNGVVTTSTSTNTTVFNATTNLTTVNITTITTTTTTKISNNTAFINITTVTTFTSNTYLCTKDICFIPNCAVCLTPATCSSCIKNYQLALSSTVCTASCGVSQCQVCLTSTACQACKIGYDVINSKCVASCSISNCLTCSSPYTCSLCSSGYRLSLYGRICEISCSDSNCLTCLSSSLCSTCTLGYTLASGKCKRSCQYGFALNSNNQCLKCNGNLQNCQECYFNITEYKCIKCQTGYYINESKCSSCSANISNCLSCKNSQVCLVCAQDYIFNSTSGSCIQKNCSVGNCQLCQSGNATSCSICSVGFTNSNGSCVINCQTGRLLVNGVCSCPIGTFDNSNSCIVCSDYNCVSCSLDICNLCQRGYYISGSSCSSCISNCDQCSDSTTCTVCSLSYIYFNSSCTFLANGISGVSTGVTQIYTCPAGCDSCSLGVGNLLTCNIVTPGYSYYNGRIIKCEDSCLTCASQNICLSCYPGFALDGQQCVACSDQNAYSCSTITGNFSLKCLLRYTLVYNSSTYTSNCTKCADNCLKCDINGAGYCDPGQCQIGYVQLVGTKMCTICFNNCPVCNEYDPSVCLSCGLRRFANYKGQCLACPIQCNNCTSLTICTSCVSGYILINYLCQITPNWPCALGSNSVCTLCIQGYTLVNGKCNYSNSCNTTSTCTICPYGYYLSPSQSFQYGSCLGCPANMANCLTCDPSNTANCFMCKPGYYVSLGNCTQCAPSCKQCTSGSYCIQAQDGYYLLTNYDGSYNGKVNNCSSPCSICQTSPNYCLTCIDQYNINGSSCVSKKILYYTMNFNYPTYFGPNDIFSVAYGKLLQNIASLMQEICTNLPSRTKTGDDSCKNCFRFLQFKQGSISFVAAINAANYSSFSEAKSDVGSKPLLSKAIIVSTQTTSSGIYDQPPEYPYQYKLALILVICLPIGFLIFLIIFAICYYIKKNSPKTMISLKPRQREMSYLQQTPVIK